MDTLCIKSLVGELTLFEHAGKIIALDWGRGVDTPRTSQNPVLQKTATALNKYFQTGHDDFKDLALDPGGTDFQRRVWRQMQGITPGATKTYGEIAAILNSSPRAVGTACGANPLPILIPCHRVVAQKSLGGYTGDGGLETKTTLLRLEGYL